MQCICRFGYPIPLLAAVVLAGALAFPSIRPISTTPARFHRPRGGSPWRNLGCPAAGADDAEAYLLLDTQTNVATEEQYTRIVTELRPLGSLGGSSVRAWYDPSCQHLVFHHIRVIRDGVATSRLTRQAVQLLRRELSLESQVLDGSLTASVLLEDVRPGTASTRHSRCAPQPGPRRLLRRRVPCGWTVPVAKARVRILCPPDRPCSSASTGTGRSLRARPSPAWKSTCGSSRHETLRERGSDPSWHVTSPWLQVSEFGRLGGSGPLGAAPVPPGRAPEELERLADGWRTQFAEPMARAAAALDWVQQNIRYVGLHLGAGPIVPVRQIPS